MKDRSLLIAILCLGFAAIPIVRSQHLGLKLKPVDLAFTAADGSPVNLADYRGKVVLIDFWATWCHPCMEEVPTVVSTYNQLHSQGFEVIGISLDIDKAQMESVARQNGMLWPQYFDGKAWSNDIAVRYGIHSIPTMWLVDKNGKVVDTDGREDLQAKVEKLLAKQ